MASEAATQLVLAAESFEPSTDGKVRPFDANASGTLFGDAVGAVVLKRLEDAERTSLSGSISTILTILSWICAGIYMCGALPSPACA